MQAKALFLLITTLLGFYGLYGRTPFRVRPITPLIQKLAGLPGPKTEAGALWIAMVTGEDRFLSKPQKETYFQLGLGHIFTPSGTHLATLGPLFRLPYLHWLFWPIATGTLVLPGFLPLGRVCWLKASRSQKNFGSFCLVMVLEGAFISWRSSPLSWLCSWLFLGLTYFGPRRSLVLWFIASQMLLSWIFHQNFSMLAPLVGVLFSLPLLLLFPVLVISSLIPWSAFHDIILSLLDTFNSMVMSLNVLHQWLPPLHLHCGHLALALVFIVMPGKLKTYACGLMLLVLSAPTGPWSQEKSLTHKWEITPIARAVLVRSKLYPWGVKSIWSDGTKCRHQLVQGLWWENCRIPSKRSGKRRTLRKLSSER